MYNFLQIPTEEQFKDIYFFMLECFNLSYQEFLDMPISVRNEMIIKKQELERRRSSKLK